MGLACLKLSFIEQQISLACFQPFPGWLRTELTAKGAAECRDFIHPWLAYSHPRVGLNGCHSVPGCGLGSRGDGQSTAPAWEEL